MSHDARTLWLLRGAYPASAKLPKLGDAYPATSSPLVAPPYRGIVVKIIWNFYGTKFSAARVRVVYDGEMGSCEREFNLPPCRCENNPAHAVFCGSCGKKLGRPWAPDAFPSPSELKEAFPNLNGDFSWQNHER